MDGNGRRIANHDYGLLLAMGGLLGFLSGLINTPFYGLFSTIILAIAFSIYYPLLKRPQSLRMSLWAGGTIGLVLGCINWLIGGTILNIGTGIIFGLTRGGMIGAIAGLITHAVSEENDPLITKAFLVVGSIFLGSVLGGSVGLLTGVFLGLLGTGMSAVIGGFILGGIVGGYLGSYYKSAHWIRAGAVAGAALATVGAMAGNPIAGMVLGAMSGAMAPMLFVAFIGAVGGLTSRGVKAMVIEALEAPTEMLEQGAVPFLVPAVITGLIVGGGVSSSYSLIALPSSLALVAATLGTLAELGSRANTPEITPKTIVEIAMMGAENWPITPLTQQFTAIVHEKETLLQIGIQTSISILGAIGGIIFAYVVTIVTH